MSRPDRAIRRHLLGLVAAAFALGIVATPGAAAQTSDQSGSDQPDVTQFGGFIASSRSNGFQLTYDAPGLLATGDRLFDLSVPEALATLNSGPVGYALSSFAYPGPLVADLGAALAAGGTDTGIPPYPVRSEAFFPSGPTETSSGQQGTEMSSVTSFGDSRAHASFSGLEIPPVAYVGSADTASQSAVEGDQVVSRTRAAVSDVSILGGLVTIGSVITDLVSTSNGTEAASAGHTTVSGVSVLGLPATIDGDGIHFDQPVPPSRDNAGDNPLSGALGGALSPVGDALGGAIGPLNDLLDQIGAQGDDALQQLFDASGIEIRLLDPIETVDGGSAERTGNGLLIRLDYDGSDTPVLTDLLNLVPASALPADNLGPVPFSPQAIFNLLKKESVFGVGLATADVSTAATPAYVVDIPAFTPATDVGVSTAAPSGFDSGPLDTAGGFETATPDLPAPAAPAMVGDVPATSSQPFPLGDAVPALAVIAMLLGTPLFAAGSRRLADNTLAATARSCPEGRDTVPEEIGS